MTSPYNEASPPASYTGIDAARLDQLRAALAAMRVAVAWYIAALPDCGCGRGAGCEE